MKLVIESILCSKLMKFRLKKPLIATNLNLPSRNPDAIIAIDVLFWQIDHQA